VERVRTRDLVQFSCEVFGLKTPGKPPAPPSVDVESGCIAEEDRSSTSRPPPPELRTKATCRSWLVGCKFRTIFRLGNYEMELTAYDRLEAPKKQAAMQWTDLTIVRPESPE